MTSETPKRVVVGVTPGWLFGTAVGTLVTAVVVMMVSVHYDLDAAVIALVGIIAVLILVIGGSASQLRQQRRGGDEQR